MMASGGALQLVDYIVFGITLSISLGIGFYYSLSGGRQKTTDEYLMGDRQMRPLPVCLSYTGEPRFQNSLLNMILFTFNLLIDLHYTLAIVAKLSLAKTLASLQLGLAEVVL